MESGRFARSSAENRTTEERGYFASLRDLDADNNWDDLDDDVSTTGPPLGALTDSLYEQVLDPDDPLVTGKHKECLEDPEDAEEDVWRQMSYRKRRKERARIRIEYNISCMLLWFDEFA